MKFKGLLTCLQGYANKDLSRLMPSLLSLVDVSQVLPDGANLSFEHLLMVLYTLYQYSCVASTLTT